MQFLQLKNKKSITKSIAIISLLTLSACAQLVKPRIFEPSWMSYDEQKQQVSFQLVATWSANNNGYNYNGYYQDDITIQVPTDWLVSITLINRDGNAPHSIVLTEPYTDDIPDELTGEFAVLSRAYTDAVYANESTSMKFKAKAGDYWLFCGVKDHGINGMWIKFKTDINIKTPFIEIKKNLIEIRR